MTDEGPPVPDPLAPWPTLSERDSGVTPEPELYEGVPPHLRRDLLNWVSGVVEDQDELVRLVLNRLRVSWAPPSHGGRISQTAVLLAIIGGDLDGISSPRPLDPLSVLNAVIGLHPDWDNHRKVDGYSSNTYAHLWVFKLHVLQELLKNTGSAWAIEGELRGLYRRVDPAATEAWRQTRKLVVNEGRIAAADNLKVAWHETYGQSPSPSAAYSAAVKAVEAVVVPVLAPGTGCTVHAAARKLRDNPGDWQFTLIHERGLPAGTGSVDVVSAMLDRLLLGETDRHTSGEHNRASTQREAETATHLAVTLVQWFASGAIEPRS